MNSFLDRDLYPKFLFRLPNQSTIWAAQGIKANIDLAPRLQEKAIVTAPFHAYSWEGFQDLPLCWIPKESSTLDTQELLPQENLDLKILSKEEIPNYPLWSEMICQSKELFQTSSLQKIVLSRQTCLSTSECSPLKMLSTLFSKSAHFKNRAAIALLPNADQLFFSMSPERLFSAVGKEITCDLVAGTFPHRESAVTSKEIAENDFVMLDLLDQLKYQRKGHIDKEIEISSLENVVSGNLYHLRRTLKSTFNQIPDYLALGNLLHPTAAICGYPRSLSKELLYQLEPHSRGYFAGYMGVISPDTAELFVTIRSALIQKRLIKLFAGAGIVVDSDPQKEWDELNLKIDPYLEMLFANSTIHSRPR